MTRIAMTRDRRFTAFVLAGLLAAGEGSVTAQAPGVITGQTLSDVNGLPVEGATARVEGGASVVTGGDGRFALATAAGPAVVAVEKTGFTSVERTAAVTAGEGTVARDARLTPLADAVTIGPAGGTVTATALTLTVPAGAVAADTAFVLTALSAQGLPGVLPLGWSPQLAFDVRTPGGSFTAPLAAQAAGLADGAVHVVRYDMAQHAWVMAEPNLAASGGGVTFPAAQSGSYAVLVADATPAPPVAAAGEPLAGVAAVEPPPGMTGTAVVVPVLVPATGGATAIATIAVESPLALPSGTLVEARLTESFTLVSGATVSEERRLQDVAAFRAPGGDGLTLSALLPLAPRRSFPVEDDAAGVVHLEVWSRRAAGAAVVGGSQAATAESGAARLSVAAGSLATDTAISIAVVAFSSFLPDQSGLVPLGEVEIDLAGATLGTAAELSLATAGATATDWLVIAKVERVAGVPKLVAVARAVVAGGRVVSQPLAGLPGVVSGGRYVFYRLPGPFGLVAGLTSSAGGPVPALVETDGLPFVGLSGGNGQYVVAAATGSNEVTATVVGTPHTGSGAVEVVADQTATLNVTVSGNPATIQVVPATGAAGLPVNTSIAVTASAPLGEASITGTNLRLTQIANGQAVAVRLVLSASARVVSVVPEAPLEPSTGYRFDASGLQDAYGGAVAAVETTFTTRADTAPAYDVNKIVFSFPDAAGIVQVTAAAGSLAPGTVVFITNSNNGVVLSLTADNDGALASEMPATIHDTMLITVTDPAGNVTTRTMSRFVDAATGRTAVGAGGGVVEGTGGVELRIAEGAVDRGVIFKAEAVDPASVPAAQRPVVPGAQLGAALQLDAPDRPEFEKEIDVAFPKPAEAPAGAHFFIYRRLAGPNGTFLFQTIDKGVVEGDKVVTASPPFSGYVDSVGSYSMTPGGSFAVDAVASNLLLLTWMHDPMAPVKANIAVVTGTVQRGGWNKRTRAFEYAPVEGAVVRRVPVEGGPPAESLAVSREDGTYSFFDPYFTEGVLTVAATDPDNGETVEATAYAVPTSGSNVPMWAQSYRAVATATITFLPETGEVPPASVDVRLFAEDASGARREIDGLAVVGQPLLLGLTRENAEIDEATIGGVVLDLVPDPLHGEPLGADLVAEFVPLQTGRQTVTVTARALNNAPVTVSKTFLVVALGGGNTESIPGPPAVISSLTVPREDAAQVTPSVLLQVAFTEPVRSVPGNVTLTETGSGAPVVFVLRGIAPDGTLVNDPDAAALVTALSLQPEGSLRFGTAYALHVNGNVVDQDGELLEPYTARFRTFELVEAGGTEARFATSGMAVVGDRAYVLENRFAAEADGSGTGGTVHIFDVSDPAKPEAVGETAFVTGRPVDLAASEETIVSNGRLVGVATTSTHQSRPSNLHLFDATDDRLEPIGVASVAGSAVEGSLVRFVLRDTYAYTITWRRGIQVVDLARMRANYEGFKAADDTIRWMITRDLNTSGRGWGQDAVVATIPVLKTAPPLAHWLLTDLEAGDYVVGGQPHRLVVATGEMGLTLVNPHTGAFVRPTFPVQSADQTRRMTMGVALALGRIADTDVAVVVGMGEADGAPRPLLAVVDLTAPDAPVTLSVFPLAGEALGDLALLSADPTDVVLSGDRAIVGGRGNSLIVSLVDLAQPRVVGAVAGTGGRLALHGETLFSTTRALTGGDVEGGGLRTASVGPCALLDLHTPVVPVDLLRDPLDGTVCGTSGQVKFTLCAAAEVSLLVDGEPATAAIDGEAPVPVVGRVLAPGLHVLSLPVGSTGQQEGEPLPFLVAAVDAADPSHANTAQGILHNRIRNRSVLPVGRTFVKGVDLLDGHLVRQGTDVQVPGRHLGLQSTRTYSSAGTSAEGLLGAGWSWSYDSQLVHGDATCGLYTVVTSDGSSQTFRAAGDDFTPQRGYHTTLERDGSGFLFTDKSGTEHRFEKQTSPHHWRLSWVKEPHGDRLAPTYDGADRLTAMAEVHPERLGPPVRVLEVSYVRVGGFDRVQAVRSDALKLRVTYTYDEKGNLIRVTRSGENPDGPAAERSVETYEYSDDPQDPHQMTAAVDPNGSRTTYEYYLRTDLFPGEAGQGGVEHNEEYVKAVREFPDEETTLSTGFVYDVSEAGSARWKTTVKDARLNDTLYVLNGNGSPLEIHEPLGRTTTMTWATDDIFKTQEIDAEDRVTDYDYDARGNLRSERITTADFGVVETLYTYDPTFNKLTYKKDAEGGETTYAISSANGDLLSVTDAVGNVTTYMYDSQGQLQTLTSPRGHVTVHGGYNSFGQARTITAPLSYVTNREYDDRGRLKSQDDSMGRVTTTVYDGFDRPVTVTRVAGSGSDNEVTSTEYYAGGQVKSVTNANKAITTFTLDGLNRVTDTSVTVDGATLTTHAEYDGNGNKVLEVDRRPVRRRMTYDALNRLESVAIEPSLSGEGPLGTIAAYTYDDVGNKLAETDLAGLTTTFVYDGLYRVKERILPESSGGVPYKEKYVHDKVGNRTRVTDANDHSTQFAYDKLNRLISTTNALNQATTITYADPEGTSKVNKSEEHDATRGLRTTYLYDALNREVERKVHLEGAGSAGEVYTTTTEYEDADHAIVVTDARDNETRTRLDGLDRVVEQVVDPGGLKIQTSATYDGLGNKKTTVDGNRETTIYRHDRLGRLKEIEDPMGRKTRYTYDGEGLKLSETDRRGVVKSFTYDNLARPRTTVLTPSISGVAWSRQTEYQDVARKRLETDARGKTTTFDLDGLGRVVKVTDPAPSTNFVETTYDGVNKRTEKDKRGNTTRFDYDALDRLTRVTDPSPFQTQTVEVTYEDAQNRKVEKDRRGISKATQMDPLGRVKTVTGGITTANLAGTLLETNTYDSLGNRTSVLDGAGKKTGFVYDAANRLSQRIDAFEDPTATTTTFQYDANGNPTEELDGRAAALGRPFSVKKTYDALNRLETVTDGEGNETFYVYDAEGHRTLVRPPGGPDTSYAYDELGQLLRVTQPPHGASDFAVTRYEYDENRNRVRQYDAEDRLVDMTYDDLNRQTHHIQHLDSQTLTTQNLYDPNGNVLQHTDPKGQTTTNVYDEIDRLTSKSLAFAPADPVRPWRYTSSIAYEYDASGNLREIDESVTSGTDPPSTTVQTTTRTYDAFDRLEAEASPLPDGGPRTVSYTYYPNGSRQTITDPTSGVTTYTYDAHNRLASAATAGGTTTYTYHSDGLLNVVAYPSGVTATHGYDLADRLTSLVNAQTGTTLSSYAYGYDAHGNRTSQVEVNGGLTETTSYTYDDLDRLETVTYPIDTEYPAGRVAAYEYDKVGNRTRETVTVPGGAALTDQQGDFDDLNRLTSLTNLLLPAGDPERVTAFTWDPNGNQLAKQVGTATPTEYRYDLRDRLVEVGQGAFIPARFQYDFEGRRTKKIGQDGLRQYVFDQTSVLVEYDEDGDALAKYEYGSDRLLSMDRVTEGRRWYSLDGLRSVVGLTDDAGASVASYHLDAWGNFRFPSELLASANRHAFTGYQWDTETDLFFAKARFYDPTVGRFTSQDSFLGSIDDPPSLHRYFYANANPTRYIDPTGHAGEAANHQAQQPPEGLMFGLSFGFEFMDRLSKLPETLGEGIGRLLTLGSETNKGRFAEQQRRMLRAATDPKTNGADRVALFGEAVKMQGAVVVEETIVRPFMEAPARAREMGVHIERAARATSAIEKTIHALEAVKAGTDAFTGLAAPAAIATGGLKLGTAGTSAEELVVARQQANAGRTIRATEGAMETGGAQEVRIGRFLEGTDVAEIRQNAARAVEEGCCVTGVVERGGAVARRQGRLKGVARRSGSDRDEFPPAVVKPDDPSGFRIDYTDPSQNRRSGVRLREEIKTLPDGTRVRIVVPPGERP